MQTLVVSHKSTSPLKISFEDEQGNALSLTGLSSMKFAVKDALLDESTVLVLREVADGITIEDDEAVIEIEDWSVLPPGDYVCDVLFKISTDPSKRSETFMLKIMPTVAEE